MDPDSDGVQPGELRDSFDRVPAAVPVVTCTGQEGRAVALLAASFAYASFDPPLVLVCVPRAHRDYDDLVWADSWALNLLGEGQARAARAFVLGVDALGSLDTAPAPYGETPVISGAALALECVPYDRHAAGDNIIFVGEVMSRVVAPDPPLLRTPGDEPRA